MHPVLLEESEVAEVDLGLDPGRRLETDHGGERPIASQGSNEVLDDGVAAAVAPLADLLEEPDRTQVIPGEASPEVVGEGVDGAGALGPGRPCARWSLKQERLDGVTVDPDLSGDPAD